MKKVLSLVLALVLVLGTSVSAFAMDLYKVNTTTPVNTGSYEAILNLGDITTGQDDVVIELTNKMLHSAGVYFGGTNPWALVEADTLLQSVFVELTGDDAALFDYNSTTQTVFSQDLTVAQNIHTGTIEGYLDFYPVAPATGTSVARIRLKVHANIKDPTTSVDTVGIPNDVKIVGIHEQALDKANQHFDMVGDGVYGYWVLTPEDFVWERTSGINKGKEVAHSEVMTWPDAGLKASHLKDVGVRRTNNYNTAGAIDDVKIGGTNGITVRVLAEKYFTKCGKTEGSFDVQLTYKNQAGGQKSTVTFKIENEEKALEDDGDIIFTDDNVYVKATESVRNVVLDAGEGLYITKSFGKGQKAYARVSLELSAGDEKLFLKYPELSDVYTLYTNGVESANVYVDFRDLADTYFVYDANFKLVGTTADAKIPFSAKYYLTTAKVDLAGTEVDGDSSEAPSEIDNSATGGGSTAPSNNYNPNTGA